MFSIDLKGHDRVANAYRRLAKAKNYIINPVVAWFARRETKKLGNKPYPSYLPHFTHVRKHKAGGIAGRFSAVKLGQAQWQIVQGNAYAHYVIGDRQLNHPSFKRWWKMRETIAEDMPILHKRITAAIDEDFVK